MDTTFLTELRGRILQDVIPLAIETAGASSDRFNLMLRIIQTGDAPQDLYSRAYDTARSIEDKEDRLDALMALLDEVEYRNGADEDDADIPDDGREAADPPQPEPQPAPDNQP